MLSQHIEIDVGFASARHGWGQMGISVTGQLFRYTLHKMLIKEYSSLLSSEN